MSPPVQAYPFEARPLTEPVDARAVSEFWRRIRAQHPTSAGTVVMWVVLGFVGLLIVVPLIGITAFGVIAAGSSGGAFGAAFLLPVILMLGAAGVGIPLGIRASRRNRIGAYRLAQFAAANGMAYEHQVSNPPLPGMIFQSGDGRMATSLLRGYSPRFVEFGNYRYTTGSGKNRSTHHWGYVAVKLDVPLPNIVLDALGNNGLGSNLPASFSRDQRLSLEGDFDRHFTLYCPRGYEQDALYLFTPDIMARFLDHAAQLDVEIVDDWLFLYTRRQASTTDPATWAWLFGAVGALMTKFDQWARWRDERLRASQADPGSAAVGTAAAQTLPFAAPAGMLRPPPGVAEPGRRLRRGASWVTIVVLALMALLFAVQFLGPVLGFFLR